MPSQPRRLRPALAALAAVAALAMLLAIVAETLATGTPNDARWRLLAWIGASWLAFALAAAALRRAPVRAAVPILVVGAIALQALAIGTPPRSTDDYYRYVWDGRVQAAGIDPYRLAPVDPALAGLRDDWLFPPACRDAVPACTRMNHPSAPTIYPPVAQAAFLALHVVTEPLGPDGGGARSLQVAAALLALGTTLALLLVLRRRGDPRDAVLWAWCPIVVLEAGNNAHVDVLAALLVVAAMGAAAAGRPVRAGLAAGAAAATKILPLLVLPALLAPVAGRDTGRDAGRDAGRRVWLRRPAVRLLTATAAVLAAVYLPHVLALGAKVLGFLPSYLAEEGYDGRARFALLRPLLPDRVAAVVAVAILIGVALAVARRTDPRRPWGGALVLVGVAFALGGVTYPWYPMLLVALVALDGRAEWLAVAAASYPGYFTSALGLPFGDTQRVSYGLALGAVLVVGVVRRRVRPRRSRLGPPRGQPTGGGPGLPSTASAAAAG
jgi:hypothetical protein